MSTARDLRLEQAFLLEAARTHTAFVEHATARLDAGEELYCDSWTFIGIRRHLEELLEEAADLGSWAALADQALDLEHGLSDLHRQQIRAVLAIAARRGAQAHETLSRALSSVERLSEEDRR